MFDLYKKNILLFLFPFLEQKEQEFLHINSFGKDVCQKLKFFLENGKMLRGSLVLQSYLLFKDNISEEAVKIGAAMELLHASLVIHDDIMDGDKLRRGKQSIFFQYETFAKEKEIQHARHFGEGMGICVGDLGFFLGYQLLSSVGDFSKDIILYSSKELQRVAFAQMQDLYAGNTKNNLTEEEIVSLYAYKTGRYTFSLPLVLGAMLAGESQDTMRNFEELGESLGILFQIKDDELDLFGDQKIIGKPVGSDIRENKKTLLRLYLYQISSNEEKKKLDEIFGNQTLSIVDITFIQTKIKDQVIQAKIKQLAEILEEKVKSSIKKLDLIQHKKDVLLQLLAYNKKRQK